MELEKIFKNLILLDFAILVLIVISSMYEPNDISQIKHQLEKSFISNYSNLTNIISLVLFFLYLISLNLLYRFIMIGKQLYLFLIVSGLIFNFLNGSVIYSSYSGLFDQLGGITSGAILILLFFSPIKQSFKK